MTTPCAYCCPSCRTALEAGSDEYACPACGRRYPVIVGIPDFRLFGDAYISIEEDRRKALRLAEWYDALSLPALVEYYWEITPGVPRDLASRHIQGALRHAERSEDAWTEIRKTPALGRNRLLDVGCGTAGFLAATSAEFAAAVGIDIALRWLVIAKKRLDELRASHIELACACAEHLPLGDGVCDLVVAEDVLDHAQDPAALLREGARVLKRSGVLYLSTPNRYSVGPDPHVWAWGVGFLPPRFRDSYVRWRRGVPYGPIRPVSYGEVRRLVAAAHLHVRRVSCPEFCGVSGEGLSGWQQALLRVYRWMRRTRGGNLILRLLGPTLQVVCDKVVG